MGIEKGDSYAGRNQETLQLMMVKNCLNCVWSFMVSITGGLMLGWWEYEYHPTNSHQWMVPFGLILFVTPVFIWFAIFTSEMWNSEGSTKAAPPQQYGSCDAHREVMKKVPV